MVRKRVAVAMSGGVDSSMAAALLKQAGYEVIGVTMQIWPPDKEANEVDNSSGCCGLDAIESAKRVAYKLGVPYYVLNLRDIFARTVITDFCQEYSLGRTPNPCIVCNQVIKFGSLLDRVLQMGVDYLATGHYARIEHSRNGYSLLKAVDLTKDQSYFLYTLGQKQLQYLLMPVGNLHKVEVRKLATKLGLPASNRRDSQDVCFIPDNDYRSFIAKYVSFEDGDIIDTEGKVLGRHNGLAQYTVGQRQGLGLASNKRLYVIRLDTTNNRLVVGARDQLLSNGLFASKLSWISGKAPTEPINMTAKVRYRSPEVTAELHLNGGVAEVNFQHPQRAISPGQAIVFYQGDAVLGGGIIEGGID
ncbi:tRNA 2-thiouridine(34) synthase MnmA [Chloroflexota bacterium]